MAKNYFQQNKSFYPKTSPRRIVIKRILAFSSSYELNREGKKHFELIKN